MSPNLVVILDNIRSLHNVGSVFRTADGGGVKEIHLCGITPTPPRHEISKTALGGEESISWFYHMKVEDAINELKQRGYSIWAVELTPNAEDLYGNINEQPVAVILGHEKMGVSEEALILADKVVKLPMLGDRVKSLNVSNTAAIVIYEFVRRSGTNI